MLTLFRKSPYFNERIERKFKDRLEKLNIGQKKAIWEVKNFENEREEIIKAYEEDLKNLELKYDKIFSQINQKKSEKINKKPIFVEYWLRVLTNNKMTKDFIAEADREPLKHLKNLSSAKLEDGNSFKLIFEFEANEYFTNQVLEKTYYVNKELLLEKIESTPFNWKEGKSLCSKTVIKNLTNKKTGEKKTLESEEYFSSFFNFFTNLRLPKLEEMEKVDYETEKDLGAHLDMEYSIGVEFTDEIIPYSLEYFVGVTHESEEYEEYLQERMMEQQQQGKNKKNKKRNF